MPKKGRRCCLAGKYGPDGPVYSIIFAIVKDFMVLLLAVGVVMGFVACCVFADECSLCLW